MEVDTPKDFLDNGETRFLRARNVYPCPAVSNKLIHGNSQWRNKKVGKEQEKPVCIQAIETGNEC